MVDMIIEPDPEEIAEICRKVRETMPTWLDEFLKDTTELPGVDHVDIQLLGKCIGARMDATNN